MAAGMAKRSWPLVAAAFIALMFLVVWSGLYYQSQIERARREIGSLQDLDRTVSEITSDVTDAVSALSMATRDALLSGEWGAERRRRILLAQTRESLSKGLEEARRRLSLPKDPRVKQLEDQLEDYLHSADYILSWTDEERRTKAVQYLRNQLTPQRRSLQQLLGEIKTLYGGSIEARRKQVLATQDELKNTVERTTLALIVLGVLIAFFTVWRLRHLERAAEEHEGSLRQNQEELRRLSQSLVDAQEEERKRLSRELHDQVGQALTALRMEVGNLRTLRQGPEEAFREHWDAAKLLGDQLLQAVRDLSMGLRPSMLDDLGLEPAIRWQARDFTRRTGIPVEVSIEGDLSAVPEEPRINAYRIVQEALTNCEKHAKARNVRLAAHLSGDRLSLLIQDDGAGFDPERSGERGVGLIGIEERAREFGGRLDVFSQPARGTLLRVEMPFVVADKEGAKHDSHSAG